MATTHTSLSFFFAWLFCLYLQEYAEFKKYEHTLLVKLGIIEEPNKDDWTSSKTEAWAHGGTGTAILSSSYLYFWYL